MKNKLVDLNNHLFAQIERLNDESLTDGKLRDEINRSKAMSSVAHNVIENARLALDAQKALGDNLIKTTPEMIGIDKK